MDALRMGREVRRSRRPKRRGMTRGALRSASEVRRWRSTEGVRLLDERGVWDVLRGSVALSGVVARPVEGRGVMRWTLRGLLLVVLIDGGLVAGESPAAVVGGGVVEEVGDVHGGGRQEGDGR